MEIEIEILLRLREAIKDENTSEIARVLRDVRHAYPPFAQCEDEALQKKLLYMLGKKLQAY